jgi:hypothetical protein
MGREFTRRFRLGRALAQRTESIRLRLRVKDVEIISVIDDLLHRLRQRGGFFGSERPSLFVAVPAQKALVSHPGVEFANAPPAVGTCFDSLFFAAPG